jgi:ubiquinone/menaquinone biosynthesis C-methylase UbiE
MADMSSFVWMKILESAPQRYDRGVRMLSCGRIEAAYERIAVLVAAPGKHILDIGCGTGGVSLACAARGATVTGIDIDAGMLEMARNKPVPAPGIDIDAGMLEVARNKPVPAPGSVKFLQLGAAEIEDHFAEASFDAVVSCLAMSEMSRDEQDYALRAAYSRLVPGGAIVIADETIPQSGFARLLYWLRRLPVAAATYLLTQTSTRPVRDLSRQLQKAGFANIAEERMWSGTFCIIHAAKVGS